MSVVENTSETENGFGRRKLVFVPTATCLAGLSGIALTAAWFDR